MNNVWMNLLAILVALVFVAPDGVYSDMQETTCFNSPCPNDTAGNPQCCSVNGTCGIGAECGVGCSSGPCINQTNSSDGDCSSGICNDPSLCCSPYNFCGTTYEHCGPGCRSGPCNSSAPSPPPVMGGCYSDKTCSIPSYCCSQYGFCGADDQYCGVNCVGGPCWTNVTMAIAYSDSLVIGLGVLTGTCTLLAIAAAVVLALRKSHFARQGPFYCAIIIAGVLLSYVAAFIELGKQTNVLCLAFPWFLGVAFNLVYGCLFIKTWVIYGMFRRAARMKKVTVAPFYILKLLGAFLTIEVIFLIIWSIVDPPTVHYMKINEDLSLYEIQCQTESNVFWLVFLIYKGAWLLFGAVLCFLMRKVTKEYNKSKAIAYSIYNNIVIILLAAPLVGLLGDVKYATMVVKVVGVLLSFTFTLFILNFTVWYKIFYAKFDVVAGMLRDKSCSTSTTTTAPSTVSSVRSATEEYHTSESTHSQVEVAYSRDSSSPPPNESLTNS